MLLSQFNDLAPLLGLGVVLASFWAKALLVPGLMLLVGAQELVLALLVSLAWSMVHVSPSRWLPSSFRTFGILATLTFLSLLGGVESLDHLALACLPWAMYPWLRDWSLSNSGAVVIWVTTSLFSLFRLSVLDVDPSLLDLMCCLFFFLVAWYRQIPPSLLFLSMMMGCCVLGGIALERPTMAGWLAFVLLLQLLDKWNWGRGRCLQQHWVWGIGALVPLTLLTSTGWQSQGNLLSLGFALLLMWFTQQEVCRLCVATARCREIVVSLMGARAGLVFWVALSQQPVQALDIFLLCVVLGLSEAAREGRLLPVRAEQILESPCKGKWAIGLQEELNAGSS